MADDRRRRRKVADEAFARNRGQEYATAAFIARRGQLGLSQEDVARSGSDRIAVRTVVNFESQGKWPQAHSRAVMEMAVGWPLGELKRLRDGLRNGPAPRLSPELLAIASRVNDDEAAAWLEYWQGRQAGGQGHSAASG